VTEYVTRCLSLKCNAWHSYGMNRDLGSLLHNACNDQIHEMVLLATRLQVSTRLTRACCRRLFVVARSLQNQHQQRAQSGTNAEAEWLHVALLAARLLTTEAEESVALVAARILSLLGDKQVLDGGVRTIADSELRTLVNAAVTERRVLRIVYGHADLATETPREIEPFSLSHTEGHWTLLAWCRERGAIRSFRFDRVMRATLTETYFELRRGLSIERFIHRRKSNSPPWSDRKSA
jgi:predicted DNA-binding transcriptional regulator YafY